MDKVLFLNKKINWQFIIHKKFIAGLKLKGFEVRGIKERALDFSKSFLSFEKEGFFLKQIGSSQTEKIKLLLNQNELNEIRGFLNQRGFTALPIKIFLMKNLIKAEIAICSGKKDYDKREKIKENDTKRIADREIKDYLRT